MIGLFRILQEDTRLQTRPFILANPGKFKTLFFHYWVTSHLTVKTGRHLGCALEGVRQIIELGIDLLTDGLLALKRGQFQLICLVLKRGDAPVFLDLLSSVMLLLPRNARLGGLDFGVQFLGANVGGLFQIVGIVVEL